MQQSGSEPENCADCGKPLSDMVLAAGLTRCTPCSAQRLQAETAQTTEEMQQAVKPPRWYMTFVRALGRLIFHIVASVAIASVVSVLVTMVFAGAGAYDANGFPWGGVAFLLSFFGYWVWRLVKSALPPRPFTGAPPVEQQPERARSPNSTREPPQRRKALGDHSMPYCSNCGHLVGDEARYCSNCATPVPGRGEGQVPDQREAASLDTVPSWLGWLAIPIVVLTSIIGLGLYSYWAYRRGRRDGVGHEPTAQPYESFGWRVVGWGVAGFVPILGWYAAVHLPTICYKQGLRVGAREGTAFEGFTSLPALGAVFGGIAVAALAALFVAGVTLAIVEGDNDDEPIRVVPQRQAPTPSGPRLTGAEAAGKANTEFLRVLQKTGVTGLSVTCDTEDFNDRTGMWIVRCLTVGPGGSLELRIQVNDLTGEVTVVQ